MKLRKPHARLHLSRFLILFHNKGKGINLYIRQRMYKLLPDLICKFYLNLKPTVTIKPPRPILSDNTVALLKA